MKLKKCPFCGGKVELIDDEDGIYRHRINCPDCDFGTDNYAEKENLINI